jgi:hypothetical protein
MFYLIIELAHNCHMIILRVIHVYALKQLPWIEEEGQLSFVHEALLDQRVKLYN